LQRLGCLGVKVVPNISQGVLCLLARLLQCLGLGVVAAVIAEVLLLDLLHTERPAARVHEAFDVGVEVMLIGLVVTTDAS
jgi:hypothetical protein